MIELAWITATDRAEPGAHFECRFDNVVMRLVEIEMALPSFYFLLALAAVIPPRLSPAATFLPRRISATWSSLMFVTATRESIGCTSETVRVAVDFGATGTRKRCAAADDSAGFAAPVNVQPARAGCSITTSRAVAAPVTGS